MREFLQLADQGHLFYPDPHEQYLRQQGMREFVGDYLQGLEAGSIDPGLRPYQREGFPAILRTMYASLGEPVDPETPNALDQLSHTQIAEASMGYGKSALFAFLAIAAGVGKMPYEGAERPLRALYLSYSRQGVKEIADACATFAPSMRVHHYNPHKHIAEAIDDYDVAVMSYSGLCSMVRRRIAGQSLPLGDLQFDLLGTDENHRRHGPRYGAATNTVARGRVEVGMTGTRRITEENIDDPVSFQYSMRQMIATGNGPSVQMLAFPTGKSIAAGIRASRDKFDDLEKPFTWKQLEPLVLDTERNLQVVELLKVLAEHGHMVLASMIPGGRCAHSEIIQEIVNEEKILDPITGKRRQVNFEPINGYMSDEEIQELIGRSRQPFHKSGLDGLLNTSLIGESLDNPNFSAVLATCPLPYIQLAQLAGRLNRGEPNKLKVFAQMVDMAAGARRPAFVAEVYGEANFFNGMVIGEVGRVKSFNYLSGWLPDNSSDNHPEPTVSKRTQSEMPPRGLIVATAVKSMIAGHDEALEAYISEGRNQPIFDETLRATQAVLEKPPPDSIKATELYKLPNVQAAGITPHSFYNMLRANGFSYSIVRDKNGYGNYVHNWERAKTFFESYDFKEKVTKDRFTKRELALEFSVSLDALDTEIGRLRAAGEDMTPEPRSLGGMREVDTHNWTQRVLLKKAIEERRAKEPPKTEGHPYESLAELEAATGEPRGVIEKYARRVLRSGLPRFISPTLHRVCTYLEPEHAQAARKHFSFPEVPGAAPLLEDLSERFNENEDVIRAAFAAVGKADKLIQGRRIIPGARGEKYGKGFKIIYPFFCNDSDAIQAVAKHLRTISDVQQLPGQYVPGPNMSPAREPQGSTSVGRLNPGQIRTADMPKGYKNAFEALENRGIFCDPAVREAVIRRGGDHIIGQHRNELNQLFLNDTGINRLVETICTYAMADNRIYISLEDVVARCEAEGFRNITERDIVNMFKVSIGRLLPLARERLGILRTHALDGKPSILTMHTTKYYCAIIIERLHLLRRMQKLPELHKLRRS